MEPSAGHYDFSSALTIIEAARETNTQVIWDIFHYGAPDGIDLFRPEFVRRLTAFTRAFMRVLTSESDGPYLLCPVNEISFFSWAGADEGCMNPFENGRGFELKAQLVRAAIESTEAIWDHAPEARIIHTDPIIHIVPDPTRPRESSEAHGYRAAQFQGWDMLCGRMWPQLGGDPKYLDLIGANFYSNNEWIYRGPQLSREDPRYCHLHRLLGEVYGRYGRPIILTETGTEFEERPDWLAYIASEVRAAIRAGVPVEGICWYPIVNHPGWDNDRHCQNGLWDYCDETGNRDVYEPLRDEFLYQMHCHEALLEIDEESSDEEHRTARQHA
jgi:hypothetical protein